MAKPPPFPPKAAPKSDKKAAPAKGKPAPFPPTKKGKK